MKTKMDLYLLENLHMCMTNCRDGPAILYASIWKGKTAPLKKVVVFNNSILFLFCLLLVLYYFTLFKKPHRLCKYLYLSGKLLGRYSLL